MDISERQSNPSLLELYFSDISTTLPEECSHCRFESIATGDFSAFIEKNDSIPQISIDRLLSLFFFSLNSIVQIRSIYTLSSQESCQIKSLFHKCLSIFSKPNEYEALEQETQYFYHKFPLCFPKAHDYTMGITAFVLCHELAHYTLGHLDKNVKIDDELEADKLGYTYLRKLTNNSSRLNHLRLSNNILGAPLLAMKYLEAMESETACNSSGNASHPSASLRLTELAKQSTKYMSCLELNNMRNHIDICDHLIS